MFHKLRHSDTCNQVKSCTKHGRPNQSQRELTVALSVIVRFVVFYCRSLFPHFTLVFALGHLSQVDALVTISGNDPTNFYDQNLVSLAYIKLFRTLAAPCVTIYKQQCTLSLHIFFNSSSIMFRFSLPCFRKVISLY